MAHCLVLLEPSLMPSTLRSIADIREWVRVTGPVAGNTQAGTMLGSNVCEVGE